MNEEYRCIIKYGKKQRCESTDTYPSNIGWLCYFHMFGKKKEEPKLAESGQPETLGVFVSEKISAGDRLA